MLAKLGEASRIPRARERIRPANPMLYGAEHGSPVVASSERVAPELLIYFQLLLPTNTKFSLTFTRQRRKNPLTPRKSKAPDLSAQTRQGPSLGQTRSRKFDRAKPRVSGSPQLS